MRGLAAALVVGGIIVTTACTSELSIENRACPCIADYVCCNHACIEGDRCPAGESHTDVTGRTLDASVSEVARFTTSGPIMCSTLVGDTFLWMDATSKVGGVNIVTGQQLAIGPFAVPADPTTKCSIAATASHIWVTLYDSGTLLQLSFDGTTIGAHAQRFGSFAHPGQLVGDETNLYVIENDSGRIARIAPPVGVSPPEAVTVGQAGTGAYNLIADGDAIYWMDSFGIRKLVKSSAVVSTLVVNGYGTSLVLANGQLYWLAGLEVSSVTLDGGGAASLLPGYFADGPPPPYPSLFDLRGANQLGTDGKQLFVPVGTLPEGARLFGISFSGAMTQVVEDDRLANSLLFVDATRFVWVTVGHDAGNVLVRPAL